MLLNADEPRPETRDPRTDSPTLAHPILSLSVSLSLSLTHTQRTCRPVEAVKKFALVAGAAVVLMSEPSAALAATAKATKSTVTQGATFELVAGSKVKPIVAKGSAEKAVYGAQKAAAPAEKAAAPAK